MHEIRAFDILYTAKVVAFVYGTMSGIFALYYAAAQILHGHFLMALSAIILIPAFGIASGFLTTAFEAWVYNELAARFGGIRIEIVPHSDV
ncbi:MAG TPA: hypothetical protein VMT58_04785 [Candidatus Binataceae bacterium]|nr:hypothetical protein [Candidatus Binataceae bacterium]